MAAFWSDLVFQAQVFKDEAALGQSYALVVQEYLDGSRSVVEGLARVPSVRAPLQPPRPQHPADSRREQELRRPHRRPARLHLEPRHVHRRRHARPRQEWR